MKKGKLVGKNYFTFLFIFILVIALFSVGYFSGFLGRITGLDTKTVAVNITIGAFSITTILNGTLSSTLNSGPNPTSYIINFTAYDAAGSAYVNDTTSTINLTMSGEVTRSNTTCSRYQSSTNYVNYTCNITMFWYDSAGGWYINASVKDNYSNIAVNGSINLTIGANTAFAMSPSSLNWSSLTAGSTNQTATNDPLLLNNTGNQPIGQTVYNISINATDLYGETTGTYAIYASNFSVLPTTGGSACSGSGCTECAGSFLANATWKNITTSFLPKGNYTVNDNSTGQETLFFCIKTLGSDLTTQAYSIAKTYSWIVKVG